MELETPGSRQMSQYAQISHHKAGGKKNWGKVRQARQIIENARKNGIDVTCDVYPYVASSFGLVNMLPEETQKGGPDRILAQLGPPKFRRQVRTKMERGYLASAHWNRTIIAHRPNTEITKVDLSLTWRGKVGRIHSSSHLIF